MLSEEQIDAIGYGLEAEGFSHTEIDEYFLEHYGTKGMKWGVRSGMHENADFKRGQIKGLYREPQSGKTQSRKARFGKRVVASIVLPGVGGVLYNGIARPLKAKSAATIRDQSKLAFGAKTALSILGGPLAVYNYQQIARPVRPDGAKK